MRTIYSLLFVFCLTACAQENEPSVDQEKERSDSKIAKLSLATTLAFRDSTEEKSVEPLYRFFERKMYPLENQDFWLDSDIAYYKKPFDQVRYVEYDSEGKLIYHPTLLHITPLSNGEKLLRVRWASVDEKGNTDKVRYVFEFLSVPTDQGYRLKSPIAHKTRNFTQIQYGPISYRVSPKHQFDPKVAQEQLDNLNTLSAFFAVETFPLTFYSCQDPSDLFRAQGFLLHPLMYKHETGGMVDWAENVWSGNNRDEYTHEIVHVFTKRKFGYRHNLMDEGLATLLGGSNGHGYTHHRQFFAKYLKQEPELDMTEYLVTTIPAYLKEDTNIPYVIGALICEHILEEAGKVELFEIMSSKEDPWLRLAKFGLGKDEINRTLRERLSKKYSLKLR